MADDGDLAACREWHELLDLLCIRQGHLDNMALAGHLCAAQGNRTQAAFETAMKSLRNWRQGIHLPQRRNFLLLTAILEIDRHDGLRTRWNQLYAEAKAGQATGSPPESKAGPASYAPAPSARSVRKPAIALVALLLVAAAAIVHQGGIGPQAIPDAAASMETVQAQYVRNVTVQVGDAVIIHGARGNECGEAPSWESASMLLPELVTGTLSDGGVGTRYSRQCGGRIPARAILFTATAPGIEQTSLYGDEIHIRVAN